MSPRQGSPRATRGLSHSRHTDGEIGAPGTGKNVLDFHLVLVDFQVRHVARVEFVSERFSDSASPVSKRGSRTPGRFRETFSVWS
jgi:hypothetical protein